MHNSGITINGKEMGDQSPPKVEVDRKRSRHRAFTNLPSSLKNTENNFLQRGRIKIKLSKYVKCRERNQEVSPLSDLGIRGLKQRISNQHGSKSSQMKEKIKKYITLLSPRKKQIGLNNSIPSDKGSIVKHNKSINMDLKFDDG